MITHILFVGNLKKSTINNVIDILNYSYYPFGNLIIYFNGKEIETVCLNIYIITKNALNVMKYHYIQRNKKYI